MMAAGRKNGGKRRKSGQVRGIVFDIDGTLALAERGTHGYAALPGAREVIDALATAGVPYCAFTNGTFKTPAQYQKSLADIGLRFELDHILTPSSVAADFLRGKEIRRVLVLGEEAVGQPLRDSGIDVLAPRDGPESVQAVFIGWCPEFRLADLEAACNAVWAGAALYTASDAPYFASRGGRTLGISGAIGAMIRSVTGRRPIVLGKPSLHGLRTACARMGLRPGEVAVVGDDPLLEVTMARRGGARAIGVTTGISTLEQFRALPPALAPHVMLQSLTEFLDRDIVALKGAS